MIVPMTKYSFLVYHREYEAFLGNLQELGVVHVIEKESGELESEELRGHYSKIAHVSNALTFFEKRDVESLKAEEERTPQSILEELDVAQKSFNENVSLLEQLHKEQVALEPWGEFQWEDIEKLNGAGIKAKLLISSSKAFEDADWKEKFYVGEVSHKDGNVYFVLFYKEGDEIEIDAEEAHLPDRSLSEVNKLIAEAEEIKAKSESIFDNIASKYLPLLTNYKEKLQGELSFEKVKLNTHKEAENRLMVLEGWAPDDKIPDLEHFLGQAGAYYESTQPDVKEVPPIKLKNNKFARLYEAIGELYTFPNYKELDLTPFFAPFYMLFFGFCLGDAGYGLLITLGCIYGLFKAKDKVKPLLKLGMYLGIATTIMGTLGGTFFGIMLHPENFEAGKTFSPFITKYQKYILSSDNLMAVSLVIGYIQVLFGMFLNAANRIRMQGFKYAVSQLGWNIIVLVTIPAIALSRMEIITPEQGKTLAIVSAIIGGIPALFYNTPGKNPLLNLGAGLWETYNVASGLLGDVLSYIRLFALGLSSAILGNVFNQLAMQSSQGVGGGIVGFLIMILILAFGHSLNFFMAALGSFVHPLRLTFVEFYKNAGFMGGGKKYEPFSK